WKNRRAPSRRRIGSARSKSKQSAFSTAALSSRTSASCRSDYWDFFGSTKSERFALLATFGLSVCCASAGGGGAASSSSATFISQCPGGVTGSGVIGGGAAGALAQPTKVKKRTRNEALMWASLYAGIPHVCKSFLQPKTGDAPLAIFSPSIPGSCGG